MKRIRFYRTAAGRCPVEEFLDALDGKQAQKLAWVMKLEENMSDLEKYIQKRKKVDVRFARGFDRGYADFKIGILLRQAREKRGITQEQLANRIKTTKSAISRVENHAEDIRLSTLEKIADALDLKLSIKLA